MDSRQGLPRSPEAEMAVLGAFFMDPEAASRRVSEVSADLMFEPRNRILLGAIQRVSGRGQVADAVTVSDELSTTGALDEAGGIPWIATLVDSVSNSSALDQHLAILEEKATRRAVIRTAEGVADEARNGGSRKPLELVDSALSSFVELGRNADRGDYRRVGDLVMPTFDAIEEAAQRGTHVTGLASGIPKLDSITSGFQPGDLGVWGGRPSMGKTAAALHCCRHLAFMDAVPVGFMSLEMPGKALTMRILAAEARISFVRLRSGRLSDGDHQRLAEAAGHLKTAPIFIDDTANLTLAELKARARRMVEREGVKLLVVDYIQLVRIEGSSHTSREQQVALVSRTLKGIAMDHGMHVMALSQLSRASQQRGNHRPVLSDLRDSGAIEQDADLVVFPYRPAMNEDPRERGFSTSERAELIVAKQRNGPIGTVDVQFDPTLMSFQGVAGP